MGGALGWPWGEASLFLRMELPARHGVLQDGAGSLAEVTIKGPPLSGRVAVGMRPHGHAGPFPSMAPRRGAGGGLGYVLPRLCHPFVTRHAEIVLEINMVNLILRILYCNKI